MIRYHCFLWFVASVLLCGCSDSSPGEPSSAEMTNDVIEKTGASEDDAGDAVSSEEGGVSNDVSDGDKEERRKLKDIDEMDDADSMWSAPDTVEGNADTDSGETSESTDDAVPSDGETDGALFADADPQEEDAATAGDVVGGTDATELEDASGSGGQADSQEPDGETLAEATFPQQGDLLIREILVDGLCDGPYDPNEDGRQDSREDEFIELHNVSGGLLDLGGVAIRELFYRGVSRHTFPQGFVLGPEEVVVIFGGGFPKKSDPGVKRLVAAHNGPGVDLGLHLTNSGNKVEIVSADNVVLDSLTYGDIGGIPVPEKGSLQRMPTGAWELHSDVAKDGSPYSPGKTLEGQWYGSD